MLVPLFKSKTLLLLIFVLPTTQLVLACSGTPSAGLDIAELIAKELLSTLLSSLCCWLGFITYSTAA